MNHARRLVILPVLALSTIAFAACGSDAKQPATTDVMTPATDKMTDGTDKMTDGTDTMTDGTGAMMTETTGG